MTHGFLQAGIQVLGGVDIASECKQSYEANNHPARFIDADVEKLTSEELGGQLNLTKDDPNLIFVGCSPCQYWTKIQTVKQKSEKSAFLLREFERFVEDFLPGFVVLENVPGLKTNSESYLHKFLDFLDSKEYEYDHHIVDASKFGVPQKRKRYLLIASRNHDEVSLPEPNNMLVTVRDVLGAHNGFPSISDGHPDGTDFMHSTGKLSPANQQRIRLTPPDGGNRFSWSNTDLQIDAYRGKDNCFRDVYGRMYWDRVAPTITTKFHSLSNGRFGHPEEHRAISLREGACLQTFPKNYVFHAASRGVIARQIGNAVPPVLAKKIGIHIRRIANGDL